MWNPTINNVGVVEELKELQATNYDCNSNSNSTIDPSEWPSGLSFGLPCCRFQVQNPLPAKARSLPSWSSSAHQACLVQVTSPMWFASYCIEAVFYPVRTQKGSGCGFPFSSKKNTDFSDITTV